MTTRFALRLAGECTARKNVGLLSLRWASSQSSRKSRPDQSVEDAEYEAIIVEGQAPLKGEKIPPLSRPLGVEEPPVPSMETYAYKSDKFYDPERSKAERQALLKEASRGYFHDYNKVKRKAHGKMFKAPSALIREDMARYFPNIAGKDLNGKKSNTTDLLKGKISLISLISTRISEEHIETYIRPVLEDQANNQLFNYIRNYLKAALVSMFANGLKREVDASSWDKYLLTRGEWSTLDVTEPMGIENKIVGYVYLVDENCKVRWAASGFSTSAEVLALRTSTTVLVERLKKQLSPPKRS